MPDNPSLLDYAPAARNYPKLIRRIAVALIVLAACAIALPMFLREVHRIRAIHLYNVCVTSSSPEIIFLEEFHGNDLARTTFGGAAHGDKWGPMFWDELNSQLSTTIVSQGTIYIGARRTPSGNSERLIGVDIVGSTRTPVIITTRTRTIANGGHFDAPTYDAGSMQTFVLPDYVRRLAIHSGTSDSADKSHFTIAFEADEKKGIIDGWFRDDLSVILEVRSEPITAPAPPLPGKSP